MEDSNGLSISQTESVEAVFCAIAWDNLTVGNSVIVWIIHSLSRWLLERYVWHVSRWAISWHISEFLARPGKLFWPFTVDWIYAYGLALGRFRN